MSLGNRLGNAIRRRIATPTEPMLPLHEAEVFGLRDAGERSVAPQVVPVEARQVDPWLFGAVVGLLSIGVVMVYSASSIYAARTFGAADYFLERELAWAAIGLCAMTVAARIDYGAWRKAVYPLLLGTIVLLVSVLVAGARINGAKRWFRLPGGISFQPAELAKLAVLLYLAYSLAKKSEKVKTFSIGFVPHMLVTGLVAVLLLAQPDLGTAVIVGASALVLLFVAGARLSYLILALLLAAPVVYQAIVGTSWRRARLYAFLDPIKHRLDFGYQLFASLIAAGSGGLFGLGLGDSRQKLFYLPEPHTDYILAILAEEMGLLGVCLVASLFVLLLWRGVRAALRARDAFGCYLGFGITALLALQAAVNCGVVLGSLPTKGLPMPFVSFGGSTLVVDLLAAGILLNISRAAPEPTPGLQRPLWLRVVSFLKGEAKNKRRGPRVRIETPEMVRLASLRAQRSAQTPAPPAMAEPDALGAET